MQFQPGKTMDHWRAFFGRAGADLWTVIEQAITLAATDYPKDFKEKRGDIAETLFARRLLQLHSRDTDVTRLSGSVVTNATNRMEEDELRGVEEEAEHTRGEDRHYYNYDEAEALNDEMEEETLLMKELYRIKEAIMDSEQSEKALLELLQRLEYLQITVEALKATEIGKHVNGLRRHTSKRVRCIVKRLVRGWKDLVDEWVKSAGDVAAAAIAGSGGCGTSEPKDEEQGLPSPPLDEAALLTARTTSMEMSQFFNFNDDDTPIGTGLANSIEEEWVHSVEPSINDNLYLPSNSQSRSLQTDLSDYDTKTSTSYNDWGITLSEERVSTSKVDFDGSARMGRKPEVFSKGLISQHGKDQKEMDYSGRLSTSRSGMASCGPGRPSNDVSKAKATTTAIGYGPGRPINESSKPKRNHDGMRTFEMNAEHVGSNLKPLLSNLKVTVSDETQVAEKLEMAKRNLHERYLQAENAKKQRTVQLVDLPDLPKGGPIQGKLNPRAQNKPGFQNGNWHQNRR